MARQGIGWAIKEVAQSLILVMSENFGIVLLPALLLVSIYSNDSVFVCLVFSSVAFLLMMRLIPPLSKMLLKVGLFGLDMGKDDKPVM